MSVSENPGVREISISGGLTPSEAENLTELEPSAFESNEYEPRDIPAVGAHIQRNDRYSTLEETSLPAEDAESYVNQLMEDPGEYVPEWTHEHISFDNFTGSILEKRDEYTLRTVYALHDSLEQEFIDETVKGLVDQPNYKHRTSPTCSGGNHGLFVGQYLPEIEELVEDETIVEDAYSAVAESSETQAAAAANVPVNQLPDHVKDEIYTGGDEISPDMITTRLRGTLGAGKCNGIEEGHDKSLLAQQPTRNNTLIALDGQLVASLKYDGDESIVGLKDVKHKGKQVLQKGMAYRVSHNVINDIEPERMDEEKGEYSEWSLANPDRLELRPLRFAGESTQYTVEGVREHIEKRRKELEEELGFT